MKKIFVTLILLACFGYAYSADKIGSWNGKDNTGSRAGSDAYITFHNSLSEGWFGRGSFKSAVSLMLWDSTALWSSDSLADDSTGVFYVPNWWGNITGKSTMVQYFISDTGASTDPKVDLKLQTRSCDKCNWFTVAVLADSDSTETWQNKVFNLADSTAGRSPQLRLYVDGQAGNSALKLTRITAILKLEKTYP